MVRCTVCYWRGTLAGAIAAPRVRPSEIPPAIEEIQHVYDDKERLSAQLGFPTAPPCPACGHHTVAVERHSVRPAA
jgi:hypothetical protein